MSAQVDRLAGLLLLTILAGAEPGLAYERGPVTGGGTVGGQVRVTGDVTPLAPQRVYKNLTECGETVRDDHLVHGRKPFAPRELIARVNVALVKAGKQPLISE